MSWEEVLNFWFTELEPEQHWKKDPELDKLIRQRFHEVHAAAKTCELYQWRKSAEGRLAEVIVLDQFSRNMFRDQPGAFACDPLALALAQEAVAAGADKELLADQVCFLYMPYMHSESALIHQVAMELFAPYDHIEYEIKHKEIIDQFGRYPHRNQILGRTSTKEEIEFLREPGSSF